MKQRSKGKKAPKKPKASPVPPLSYGKATEGSFPLGTSYGEGAEAEDGGVLAVDSSPMVGSADIDVGTGPKAKQWRVVRTARYCANGVLAKLPAGKLIDERHYDVPGMIAQGVELEPED